MSFSRVSAALATALVIAIPGLALAQAPVQDRGPDPPKSPQAERAPAPPAPAAQPAPKRAPVQAKVAPDPEDPLPPEKKPPPAPANVIACNGVFAKESTHIKLAMKYDSRNITYGQVDGPEGSKIPGSILFPNDPKRRLEVLWAQEAGRSGTSVIAINGKSQWSAPKGMKLGMPLAALEKANGRPFKVSGFDTDGSAGVSGWEGGALSNIPGGCKMGMRLIADPKASPDARSAAAGEKEFLSNDEAVRALKPTVVEILIGY
ncbi:MAG: hypothetical protein WCG92_00590 [Hyphomicrobiales bacterium]